MKIKTLVSWGSLTCLQKVRKEEMVSRIDKLQWRNKALEKGASKHFILKYLLFQKLFGGSL